ncbi:uncharacterized protein (DUF2267 family) [Saccharopolyspora lacisalsi]|uniref:Uncharacterized protein (DUF2267 family) n=1 Tax=Halosaccharopolyspora lacisalsi TaxID=1000566 RepID=A0A839E054_9PSEU|nr:DUF2267 domain-containing protein [Halosaccharopolyspora lacisalsi]MBA8826299.1 uncharacterized protein (DUF2267 family) [Halosaccharopolyspora lacisalsi]
MKHDELLARVRDSGEYDTREETERVVRVVLAVLGVRLGGGEAEDLAAQVPDQVSGVLTVQADSGGVQVGIEDFLREVSRQLGTASTEAARWDASAVLTTLAEGITGGELNQLLSQLPSGYAPLFDHPELT